MLKRIKRALSGFRKAETHRIRVWLLYGLAILVIAASHLISWFIGVHLIVCIIHGTIGGMAIGVSLFTMLRPVFNLFRVTSTLSNITKDRSKVHQLHLGLIEKGTTLVKSIRDLKEVLEGTLSSLIQEHEVVIRKPLEDALFDVTQQMRGAEEMTEIAKELETAVKDEIKQMREREIETSTYLRTEAQVQMVNNFWNEIHGFIFLNIGFGFLYYGLWTCLQSFGIMAFRVPAEASITLSDFLYYSAVTVSTLGYGEIHPALWPSQFLAVLQIVIGATFVVGIIGVLLSLLTSDEFYKRRIFQEASGKRPDVYTDDLEEWNVRMGSKSGKLSEEFSQKLEHLSQEFDEVWQRHRQTFREIGLM
ncbi:MAG: two pore domain potassium channel family protein [Gemmatimonadota bacterium]|nr:MAG: two pore domain potassium channel family protein [Gemmatimonadota bacterium]